MTVVYLSLPWAIVLGLAVAGSRAPQGSWTRRAFGPRRPTRLERGLAATLSTALVTDLWGLRAGLVVGFGVVFVSCGIDALIERRHQPGAS
ncbi:MAG: hypothetical protein JWN46_549 [Acidimicrobiales bacterium]|nr:hypothetical protein [Acidimicrobiales bacterium]